MMTGSATESNNRTCRAFTPIRSCRTAGPVKTVRVNGYLRFYEGRDTDTELAQARLAFN